MGRVAEALAKAGHTDALHSLDSVGVSSCAPLPTAHVARLGTALRSDTIPDASSVDFAPTEEVVLPDNLDASLSVLLDSTSEVAEQYRAIRTRILRHNVSGDPCTIAITSCNSGDGRSVTAINVAFALAEIRHLRVAVVDADFCGQSLARMLRVDASPGLAEAIRGDADFVDVIRPTHQPNVSLVAGGELESQNASQLLGSRRMEEFLRYLRNEFHYVLIDTAPLTSFANVGTIAAICTGVFMLIRLNRTSEQAAKQAVRMLQSNNINLLGCILTAGTGTWR